MLFRSKAICRANSAHFLTQASVSMADETNPTECSEATQAAVEPAAAAEADPKVTEAAGLSAQVATLTEEVATLKSGMLRLAADADNTRKRLEREKGDMTHSVAVIDACKPYHWRDRFPPSNTPSAETLKKAREKFGWLLEGK